MIPGLTEQQISELRSWGDYGVNSYGQGGDVWESMNKAMTTTGTTGSFTTEAGITPLRLEDLSSVLTSTQWGMKDIKLWTAIYKSPCFNTVWQYNRLTSYGDTNVKGSYAEGGVPAETDSTYSRETSNIKYYGVHRQVSLVVDLVRTGGGVISARAQENVNGTKLLLRQIELGLFFDRADLIPTDMDGLTRQIFDYHQSAGITNAAYTNVNSTGIGIIDMAGQPLSEAVLSDVGESLANNYVSDFSNLGLYMGNEVLSDLDKQLPDKQRVNIIQTPTAGGYVAGVPLKGYNTNFGYIPLIPSVFIRRGGLEGAAGTHAGRPNAPATVAAVAGAAGGGLTSLLTANTYFWGASACNEFGESGVTEIAAGVATTAGQIGNLTINDPATGPTPRFYRIYRGTATGQKYYMWSIPRAAAATTWSDYNFIRPATSMALALPLDQDIIEVKQLAPMMQYPLARITTAERWLVLMFLGVALRAPTKTILIKNIGPLT